MTPRVVIFSGPPGSGKSTLADIVATDLHAPVLNWDWAMAALRAFPTVEDALQSLPRNEYHDVGYALIDHQVTRQLQLNQSAIVDCVARDRAIDRWAATVSAANATMYVIECECSAVEVHRARVEGRTRSIPNWYELEWSQVERSRAAYEPLATEKLRVDTVAPLEDVIATVRRYIGYESDERRTPPDLVRVQQVERERIASQLHDDPIQLLTVAVMRLDLLSADIADPAVAAKANDARAAVRAAIDQLRAMLFELDPPSLPRDGLAATLDDYLDDLFRDADTETELNAVLGHEPSFATRSAVFRIAREAIANARKHADARHVRITVRDRDGGIGTVVADDGRGFDPASATDGRRRGLDFGASLTLSIGGRFHVTSAPGSGTTVDFWIPERS